MGYKDSPPEITTRQIGLLRARAYRGVYSRVARRLGITRSVVQRVGNGQKKSARIETALTRELQRIERHLVRFEKKIRGNSAA